MLNNSGVSPTWNETHLVLIPKKTIPEKVADLRPIALCNVLYKIIAKTLANILKTVLLEVISETQSAFIPGRIITHNIIISFETCHHIKRKRQGKHGLVAMKTDMSKAITVLNGNSWEKSCKSWGLMTGGPD